jgi:hypothetical protein
LDRIDEDEFQLERSRDQGGRARRVQTLPLATVAGFAAAVGALILISVLSYRSVQEWNRATARTSHTIAVLDAVDGLMAALTDARLRSAATCSPERSVTCSSTGAPGAVWNNRWRRCGS